MTHVPAGLLVVAKDEQSLTKLKEQFKNRSVQRTYQSITLGCPSPSWGQVATTIGRDARDRKKMGAYALDSGRYTAGAAASTSHCYHTAK